ncbi:hypothetical protein CBS101457_002830 [Exobasidium rhododendri]|nr:hypothetical protein CBS101457_002830 [Exobasidium rhododendri]
MTTATFEGNSMETSPSKMDCLKQAQSTSLSPPSGERKNLDKSEPGHGEGRPRSTSQVGGLSVAQLLSSSARKRSGSSKSPTEDANEDAARSTSSKSSVGNAKSNLESTTSNEAVAAYQYTAMQQVTENRENIEYKLTIREQPKHSRMCGVGEKADRRPIDPAPIIQLRVITHDHGPPPPSLPTTDNKSVEVEQDHVRPVTQESPTLPISRKESVVSTASSSSGGKIIRRGVPIETSWGQGWEDKTWYLENPYYFMYAMLADAETDEELHLLQDGKTRYTTGSCVSCLYHLKDIDGSEQGFFVFPDLSIRVEGRYRLKLCLFETIGHEVHHCKSVYSTPFNVYTAKRFPGMEESTLLSKSFADQGLKVRVRKNPRARRSKYNRKRKGPGESDDDSDERLAIADTINASEDSFKKKSRANEVEYGRQMYEQAPLSLHAHQTRPGDPLYARASPHRERRYTTEGSTAAAPGYPYHRPHSQSVLQAPDNTMAPRRDTFQLPRMHSDPRLTLPPTSNSPTHARLEPFHQYNQQPHLPQPHSYSHPYFQEQQQQQQQQQQQHQDSSSSSSSHQRYQNTGYPDERYPPRYSNNSHATYQEQAPPTVPLPGREGGGGDGRYEESRPRFPPPGVASRDYPSMHPSTSPIPRDSHVPRGPSPLPPPPRSEGKESYNNRHDARHTLPPLQRTLGPQDAARLASQPYYDGRPSQSAIMDPGSSSVHAADDKLNRHMPPPHLTRNQAQTGYSTVQQQPGFRIDDRRRS